MNSALRDQQRIQLLRVACFEWNSKFFSALVLDISETGAQLLLDSEEMNFGSGNKVLLQVFILPRVPLRVEAKILWSTKTRLGLRFESVLDCEKAVLRSLVKYHLGLNASSTLHSSGD